MSMSPAEFSGAPRPLAPRKPGDPGARRQVSAFSTERQRVRRACIECRVKKVKCNGADPCARCTSFRISCEYGELISRNAGSVEPNVEKLEARLASMEQMFHSFLEQFESIQGNGARASPAHEPSPSVNNGRGEADVSTGLVNHHGEAPSTSPRAAQASDRLQQLLHVSTRPAEKAIEPHPVQESLQKSKEQSRLDVELEQADSEEPCYADGFGELDMDVYGQLRYVGLGSTASVVDNCVGLRRHILKALEKKGYESEEPLFASPEATHSPKVTASSSHLPPQPLVDLLISIFARELVFLFPITTERDVRKIYKELSTEHELDPGYAAVFFAILAVASPLVPYSHPIFSTLDAQWKSEHLGATFYNEAMHHVNTPFRRKLERKGQNQDIVVALGLLSMYLAETGSQAEAWISVGRAIRNAQDLGLHRSPERLRLPKEERNKRRYIWWCLYILERQLCTALGRPLSIDDQDCDTEVPSVVMGGACNNQLAGFTGMIHLHRIIGQILKLVNSVGNAYDWRSQANSEKINELRMRVREANEALQTWAKDMVPPQIKAAKSGTLLAEKHIALSSFFSAVMLLHRVFMSNPHRPSPLAESQAQLKSAKAATDCIRETSEFFKAVPRSHYVVFHGQCVFVSAIVLLHSIRCSEDPKFVYSALRDVERAMEALQSLEGFWKGAKKCRATVEEYLDFTFHVLQGDRKGKCQFACDHDSQQYTTSCFTPKKRAVPLATFTAKGHKRAKKARVDMRTPETTETATLSRPQDRQQTRNAAPQHPTAQLAGSVVTDAASVETQSQQTSNSAQQLEDTYFDDTIGNFLGAISPDFYLREPCFGGLTDLVFDPSEMTFLSPDSNGLQNSFF